MKKIAILGGSFSPFHNGHAAMTEAARNQIKPDEIWIMPAKKPPHKPSYGNIKDSDRVNMLNAYANEFDDVFVHTEELNIEGFTYTADTLKLLTNTYPDYKFYFIIGGDSIANFKNWYKADKIVKRADLAICCRADKDNNEIKKIIKELKQSIGGNYILLDFEPVDISSTMIREAIQNDRNFKKLLPEPIYKYIVLNNLYNGDNTEYSFEDLKEYMKESLPEKRYIHCLGVVDTAAHLAEIYGVDIDKAKKAAILHDCAKPLSAEQLKNLCDQNKVSYDLQETATETITKSLLHSKAGSILAKNLYYIKDEDILNSIFYHTVGRPEMSMLEKIIFTADYIEPGRKQKTKPNLDKLRAIADENIDKAVYYITKNTIDYLKKDKREIDNKTEATLKYYKQFSK